MPMGRLAEIIDASMSSTTGIIDRMEEKGLVERVRVPDDRRIVLVRSTAAGLALIDEEFEAAEKSFKRAISFDGNLTDAARSLRLVQQRLGAKK